MKYDEFIEQVRQRAGFGSSGEAIAATRATLDVLGQRLFGNLAQDLAAQLPAGLALFLGQAHTGEQFDVREFFKRVGDQQGVDVLDAVVHARAVMAVVCEAVSPDTIEQIRAQLPRQFAPLFGADDDEVTTREPRG